MRLLLGLCVLLGGCAQLQTEPVQSTVRQVFADVVRPAVADALRDTVTGSWVSGGNVQGIAPAYVIDGSGYWVVGVQIHARVAVEGVAGQIDWQSQADAGAK